MTIELERALSSPEKAYDYAIYVTEKRFPEGEPVIAQDSRWAYYYARDVINDRWPEAESVIAQDPEYAYLYARDVIEGRFPEAEPLLARSEFGYRYARQFNLELKFVEKG